MLSFLPRTRARETRPRECTPHDTDQIYRWIVAFKRSHDGLSPTLREIMEGCGISSTSVAHFHVAKLQRQGKVRRHGPGMNRNLVVVGGSWQPPAEAPR